MLAPHPKTHSTNKTIANESQKVVLIYVDKDTVQQSRLLIHFVEIGYPFCIFSWGGGALNIA